MSGQLPREPREQDWETVVADDLRPNGDGKHCFYCRQPLGSAHDTDCVIRRCAGHYHIAIRRNVDGLVRMYRHDMTWDECSAFSWLENNYSCDCNRYLFFQRAEDDPEDDARGCGEGA